MKILKFILRILFAILFTENQRNTILEALEYSRLTYERRNKKEEAAKMEKIKTQFASLIKARTKVEKADKKRYSFNEMQDAIKEALKSQKADFADLLKKAKIEGVKLGAEQALADGVGIGYQEGHNDSTLEIFLDLKKSGVDISKLVGDEVKFYSKLFDNAGIEIIEKFDGCFDCEQGDCELGEFLKLVIESKKAELRKEYKPDDLAPAGCDCEDCCAKEPAVKIEEQEPDCKPNSPKEVIDDNADAEKAHA